MQGVAPFFRHNRDVDLRDRLEQDAVEQLVGVENRAVERLEGIVVLLEHRALGRVGRRSRAAGECEQQQQAGGASSGGSGDFHQLVRKIG